MKDRSFSLALTGDLFIASHIKDYKDPDFLEVFQRIREQDLAFTNLEVLLNDYQGVPAAESGGTYAGAPSALVEDIKWAGFHMVSRANNHSLDYSYEGLRLTSRVLDREGIVHAGVGENLAEARSPAYIERHFGRVALLSASSTFAAWGRAGHARPDFQGRPGLSPLRYRTYYVLPRDEMQALVNIKELLSAKQEKGLSGWTKEPPKGVTPFFGLEFREGEKPEICTEPEKSDVEEIVKWIKDAKRQADLVVFSLHAHESRGDREVPAQFIVDFAHECIDAGVDIFVGHGPHLLRGIEVYKGKPIFYSLGNFVFQNDLVKKHPHEIYQRFSLGFENTPADIYDVRSKNDTAGFPADPIYWESVLAIVRAYPRDGTRGFSWKIELIPLDLGFNKPRPQRGKPAVARGDLAAKILARLKDLSEAFGTHVVVEGERGLIEA